MVFRARNRKRAEENLEVNEVPKTDLALYSAPQYCPYPMRRRGYIIPPFGPHPAPPGYTPTAVPIPLPVPIPVYDFQNFPVSVGTNVQIESFKLEITGHRRPPCLTIRLKSMQEDVSRCAILPEKSKPREIREAVRELGEEYKIIRDARDMNKLVVNKSSLPFLAAHHIVPLEKISPSFPDSAYYCDLCCYHISSVAHARNHLESPPFHLDEEKRQSDRAAIINALPKILPNQADCISQLIKNLVPYPFNNGLYTDDCLTNFIVNGTETIRSIICDSLDDDSVVLLLYGSVLSESYIRSSDINYLIDVPSLNISDSVTVLRKIYNGISKYQKSVNSAVDVKLVLNVSPRITFTLKGVHVVLTWRNYENYESSRLIYFYTQLCPNLNSFLRLIRIWAKISGIDISDKTRPGLSSYGFDLMAIHYLQRLSILPVIHELLPEKTVAGETPLQKKISLKDTDLDFLKEKCKDIKLDDNFASLFVEFLRFVLQSQDEVIQIVSSSKILRKDTKWKKNAFQISDPNKDDNVVRFSKAFQAFFLNCFLKSFLYFAVPSQETGPLATITLYQKMVDSPRKKKKKERGEKGDKGAEKVDKTEKTEKIDGFKIVLEPKERDAKGVSRAVRRLDLEDGPCSKDKEVEAESDYDVDDLSFKLLSTLVFRGKTLKDIVPTDVEIDGPCQYSRSTMRQLNTDNILISEKVLHSVQYNRIQREEGVVYTDYLLPLDMNGSKNGAAVDLNCFPLSPMDTPTMPVLDHNETMNDSMVTCTDTSLMETSIVEDHQGNKICFEEFFISFFPKQFEDIQSKALSWESSEYRYTFDEPSNFNNSFCPEFKCSYCDKMDHAPEHCPIIQPPPIKEFPKKRPAAEIDEISRMITANFKDSKLSDKFKTVAAREVKQIEKILQTHLDNAGIRLEMFGSMTNLLGNAGSDVDICFRFDSDKPPENLEGHDIIRRIFKVLSSNKYRMITNLVCILSAKVPIVKFKYQIADCRFEADISYYNVLALNNTDLLREYVTIDERMRLLGFWVKRWAKRCDIGDASKGSLSSYSYIIMLIHYLQNCSPPVLPFLQEDLKVEEPVIVDGWDVRFNTRENYEPSKNKETVAQLFLGFLDYFCRFDYEAQVIQIRRKQVLLKMEKDWKKPICLEDPFDLNHNLGAGVSTRMFAHIRKCFIKSREVFYGSDTRNTFIRERCSNAHVVPRNLLLDLMEYSFKACYIGEAPPDRQCRFCMRVGHFVENCPTRSAKKRTTQPTTGQHQQYQHHQPKTLYQYQQHQQQNYQQKQAYNPQQQNSPQPYSQHNLQTSQPQSHPQQQTPRNNNRNRPRRNKVIHLIPVQR